jgi:4-amino-4-deoxy-L-arabinose transferase-like glycosyltransferase
LPLYLDEAYYWLWSKHLDIGYLDHPFVIAVMIKIATLFGDTIFDIRLVSVFCFSVASVFIYFSAKRAFGYETAIVSLVIFLASPAATMGFTITSPDSPLIMFWSMALYFSYRAIFEQKRLFFILAGSCIGLALSSKYTAILFLGFIALFYLIRRPKELLGANPWLAVVFATVFFAPTIYWNYTHEWASFAFQFNHGTNSSFKIDWHHFFEFFGGLFLLFSPIFFGYFLFLVSKFRSWFFDDKLLFFALSGIFVLLFFLYKGLFLKMQLNWVAPAFVSLTIFVAKMLVESGAKKIVLTGVAISLLMTMLIRFPTTFGLKGEKNFHSRIYGYKELGDEVERVSLPDDLIFADHLTLASILSFYLPEFGEARVPIASRPSMFDMWQKGEDFKSQHGLYVSDDDKSGELAKIWQNVELLEIYQTSSTNYKKKKFYIYRVK